MVGVSSGSVGWIGSGSDAGGDSGHSESSIEVDVGYFVSSCSAVGSGTRSVASGSGSGVVGEGAGSGFGEGPVEPPGLC